MKLSILIKSFLKSLNLELLEEQTVVRKGLIKMMGCNESSLLRIILGKGAIDGSEIGQIFILIQMKFYLADQSIDLGIEFDSEKSHNKLYFYLYKSSIVLEIWIIFLIFLYPSPFCPSSSWAFSSL